jgi:DNA-binding transcriptional ArsR family regulator/predicted nucleotidyltransferase
MSAGCAQRLCVVCNGLCMMRTGEETASALVPLFRSEGQARVLREVFGEPGRAFSLSELARRTGLHPSSVQREVSRLEDAGVLLSERLGSARIVHTDASCPIHAELSGIVAKTLGPPVVIGRALAGLPGVERAYLFGSWAHRALGGPGAPPRDLDLLVVGAPDRAALSRACREATGVLGREVQPVVVPPADWDPPRTGFLRAVRGGALVAVPLGGV